MAMPQLLYLVTHHCSALFQSLGFHQVPAGPAVEVVDAQTISP